MPQAQSHRRSGMWAVITLFGLTIISRIPFRSQILYHWDSVNFSYAMREFSVAKEQPQPPGYIVYVWLCRVVDLLFGDPQVTMVWISVIASALAVVALFYLGRAMFNTRVGLIAALFLATSPLFWFYGEIALPHSLDMLLVIVGLWWLYETMKGQHRYLYPAIAVFAVAGGVRQQTLVFLAPMILFALRKIGRKQFLIASALGVAICLLWFVPLAAASGGVGAYLETMSTFADPFNATTSVLMGAGWWGVRRNLRKLTMYTLFGSSATLLPLAAYVALKLWKREWTPFGEKIFFFALWLAPTMIFYTFIHMGQQGLILIFLPALLLWAARALTGLLQKASRQTMAVATIAVLVINIGIFLLAPEQPLGGDRLRLLTRSTLLNSDHYYQYRFELVENNFPLESTAILAVNWHHVEYYLPSYRLIPIDLIPNRDQDTGPTISLRGMENQITPLDLGLIPDGDSQIIIIIFDNSLSSLNKSSELTKAIELPHGDKMEFLTLAGDQALCFEDGFYICEP